MKDILVTPKYVIHCYYTYVNTDSTSENFFVYKKDDLSLFCTNKDIGKLMDDPTMQIVYDSYKPTMRIESKYLPGTFMNENHFITIRNDKNVIKYFDFYNDKVIDNQDLEKMKAFIPLSNSDRYRSLFYAKEQDNTKSQQYFEHQSFIQNADYETFVYKETVFNGTEIFIGMIGNSEGFLWKIPLKSICIIKATHVITEKDLKNFLKNSRIIGNILYLQLDYTASYHNFRRVASHDNISTICAIDKLTGKIIWIYDTYEFSTAKLVKDAQK